MARLSRRSRSTTHARTTATVNTARALPWLLLGQAVTILRDHWASLSPADRNRLAYLVRQSKGRPINLTVRERAELKNIVQRVDLQSLGRSLAVPLAANRAARKATHRRK
jgi:hypothetical protein